MQSCFDRVDPLWLTVIGFRVAEGPLNNQVDWGPPKMISDVGIDLEPQKEGDQIH